MRNSKIKQEILDTYNYIDSDIKHCLSTPHGGYFSTILLVFTLINYLGVLWSGKVKNNEKDTISFIKKYFKEDYHKYPALIYIIYRHGISHERMPKLTQLNKKGKIITLYFSKKVNPQHLKLVSILRSNGKRQLAIYMSIKLLLADLILALKAYEKDLFAKNSLGANLRRKFSVTWKEMRKPKKERDLLQNYNSYLSKGEFNNIRVQIRDNLYTIRGP